MKKPAAVAVISVGVALLIFLAGMFVGRNTQPTSAPSAAQMSTAAVTEPGQTLLNLNTADIWQLQEIPGIGEILARRIVEYRRAHGGFSSVQQLLDVDGIGLAKLNTIMEYICLED